MLKSRTQRLTTVGVVVALIATALALASGSVPSANAAPGKIPDGARTFTTLEGQFNVGGGSITLPVRHPNSPMACADGVDNELGEFHGGAAGLPGISAKDGLVDFGNAGATGYAESNAGEATAAGLQTFPKGCVSAADDNELFAHTMGISPGGCSAFGCGGGYAFPDPQARMPFDIDATVTGNNIAIANAAAVAIPDNVLLFGSCLGAICVNYIARVQITANNNELQELRINATGGTYTLTLNGETTAPIAYNAMGNTGAAGVDTVEEAIAALPSVGAAQVDVTGGLGGDGGTDPYRIEFLGTLAGTNVNQMTADITLLTDTTPPASGVITTMREGGAGLTGTTNNDGSGSILLPLNVRITLNKTLDADPLGPAGAQCQTSINLSLTSETSGALQGERFDTTNSNLKVVDGTFVMPPFVEAAPTQSAFSSFSRLVCGGANDALGLWDGAKVPINMPGDNAVEINASTAAGPWDTAGSDIVANAGTDQAVTECDPINLDASSSWNAAKADAAVAWSQTAGDAVLGGVGTIQNPNSVQATTVAPPGDDSLTFSLDYTTLIGPHPSNTRTHTDTVNVAVTNVAPTSNAGADFAVSTNKTGVPLRGVVDDLCTETGDLTTLWTQTGGPSVGAITNASSPTGASFSTAGIAGGSTLTFQLSAGDGDDTTLDTVSVTVDSTAPGTIGGNVTVDGTATAGINARIYSPGTGYVKTAVTNGSGDYAANALTDGAQYAVMFHDPTNTVQRLWYGNSTNTDDRTIVTAPDGAVNGTLTSAANAGRLQGTVVNAATGAPESGVSVVLHDQNGAGFVWDINTNTVVRGQATTAGDGTWEIEGLNPGTYRVRFEKAGFMDHWYDGRAWGWTATEITVANNQDVTGVDGSMTPLGDRATLSGTITDESGINEVQTITVTSAGTRSMFDVTFGGSTIIVEGTQPANDLETDLERLPGLAGNIDVTGTPGNYAVEFVGALSGTDVADLVVASRNERQSLRVSVLPGVGAGQCGGTLAGADPEYTCFFRLTFDGQTTADIAGDATGATIQAALEALPNIAPGDIAVTPATAIGNQAGDRPAAITFLGTGAYALQDVPEILAIPGTDYALGSTFIAESMGNNTQGASVETISGGSTVGVVTTFTSAPNSGLPGIDVRAYSASKGKFVRLDTTDGNGDFSMLLPLDTYKIRIIDPGSGNVGEWYDNIYADVDGPGQLIADVVDLTAADSTFSFTAIFG